MNESKRIMVICGGRYQIDIVKKAKELGHYVFCTSRDENIEDSPAFAYADEYAAIDIFDKEKNLKAAYQFNPDAVISDQSDMSVPTVAYISEKLGLQGIGVDKARLFTNKYAMRMFCKEYGFPCPDFTFCETKEEAESFLKNYDKIVIKPLDSQASRGVSVIRNSEQLEMQFPISMSFSNDVKAVIAEQFIPGTMFTAEGIKTKNSFCTVAVSQKTQYVANPMVSRLLKYTHFNDKFDMDLLRATNNRLITEMNLPFGITHSEYIYSDGTFYLVETAARGGGCHASSRIIPYMTGVDVYGLYINQALGKSVPEISDVIPKEYDQKECVMEFLDFGSGEIQSIQGMEVFEELLKDEKLLDYQMNFAVGDIIAPPVNGPKRHAYFIAAGKNNADVENTRRRIKKHLNVITIKTKFPEDGKWKS